MKKIRADECLVLQGLCESRSQAKILILLGRVYLPHKRVEKPSELIPVDSHMSLTQPMRYVSRGADKLHSFFEHFPLDVSGKIGLDLGASTGGFTDYLLQAGIAQMTCVDVGHSQLHPKLKNDPRVHNFEKINARHLADVVLPHLYYDLIVMDLSFISVKKVLPGAWNRLAAKGRLIALIKPQFEATKKEADAASGVIKDEAIIQRILDEIRQFIAQELRGATLIGIVPSALKGATGNQEYLIGVQKDFV